MQSLSLVRELQNHTQLMVDGLAEMASNAREKLTEIEKSQRTY